MKSLNEVFFLSTIFLWKSHLFTFLVCTFSTEPIEHSNLGGCHFCTRGHFSTKRHFCTRGHFCTEGLFCTRGHFCTKRHFCTEGLFCTRVHFCTASLLHKWTLLHGGDIFARASLLHGGSLLHPTFLHNEFFARGISFKRLQLCTEHHCLNKS